MPEAAGNSGKLKGSGLLRNPGELLDGKNAVLLLVCNNVADQLVADDLLVVGESVYERGVAENVDHSRNPAAGSPDQCTSLLREKWARSAHSLKAKGDIVGNFSAIQRPQMKVGRNSLRELMQLGQQEQIPQLGLPDKDELQDLELIRVDIGQHPQMLEGLGFEILCFVDN